MARKSRSLELVIHAKDAASRELRKVDRSLGTMRGSIGRISKAVFSLRTAFLALGAGAAIYGIKRLTSQWETLTATQEKAEAGMVQALKSMGRYTTPLHKELLNVASGLQKVTTFGDEATIEGMKFLLTYKDITDDMLPRTSAAMLDLAQLMGGDTKQAANMLGKASMGMTGELRRVGITVDSNTYKTEGYLGVLKAIESQVKGQAKAIRDTDAGGLTAFGNAVDDIKEKLGTFTQKIKAVMAKTLFPMIDKINEKLKEFIASPEFGKSVKATAVIVLKSIREIVEAASNMINIAEAIAIAYTFAWENIKQTFDVKWIKEHITNPLKQAYNWINKYEKIADKWINDRLRIAKEFYFGGDGLLAETTTEQTKNAIAEIKEKFEGLTGGVGAFRKGIDAAITSVQNMKISDSSLAKGLGDKGIKDAEKLEDMLKNLPEAQKMLANLDLRIRTDMDAPYDKELAEMDARQANELDRFKKLLDDKLAAEMGYIDEAAAIKDMEAKQSIEKDQLIADQSKRIWLAKLDNARTVAGGLSDIFQNLYEMSGEKNKEMFYAAKAAAIAEATINIAQGISKALAQGGVFGPIMAGVVAAAGAIQIAKITAQSLAEGGMVLGQSPSPTADNIDIKATAGEYVQPVSAVRYYGAQAMEAIRSRMVPREFLANAISRTLPVSRPAHAFAGGGMVEATGNAAAPAEITLINFIDPREMDQYLATPSGQSAVVNVISRRAGKIRKILR